MKWLIGGAFVLVVLSLLIGLLRSKDERSSNDVTKATIETRNGALVDEVKKGEARITGSAGQLGNKKSADKVVSSDMVQSKGQQKKSYDDIVVPSVDSAIESMREGLVSGDSRTPELSDPLDIEQPSLEVLDDPVLYQQYEQQQTLNRAGAYFSAVAKELPLLRAKIAQARQNGSQSEEEIRQAEEALQKLELLQLEYEWQMPEVSKDNIQLETPNNPK